MEYRGTFIYVMQFEYVFQYLFAWEDWEIFQNNVVLLPRRWERILWKLGFLKDVYTKKQLEEGEQVILSAAMTTIDEISSPGYRTKRKKAEQAAQARQTMLQKTDCIWQAHETKDGMHYQCVVHGESVPMRDGEKPSYGPIV